MAISLAKLGEQRITVPVAVLVGLFWVGWNAKDFTVEGLDEFFFSEAQGEELASQVKSLNENLTSFISKTELRELNREISEIGDQISETQLWISANGANDIAKARLADLIERRDVLMARKACLLNDSITNKELCGVN